jgi:hypothetical protein
MILAVMQDAEDICVCVCVREREREREKERGRDRQRRSVSVLCWANSAAHHSTPIQHIAAVTLRTRRTARSYTLFL